ncbi:MAG TPA: RNA polymerase sigma factor [Vicinamibacterales bacterium]|nr:RNA polymerase sigma factor [Vicinamibacterales bacterium]
MPVETPPSAPSDGEVVERVRNGETALFEILMRRHNQRVYRAARAIVKDDAEAEDVMQQAYINAFIHLKQFESRAQFSTWLTRITIYEALARRRKQRPEEPLSMRDDAEYEAAERVSSAEASPDRLAYSSELGRLIEDAVDALPESYRAVFMLRDVEGLSTLETAEGLGVGEEAVKTRLHRARAMVRQTLSDRLGASAPQAFQFHATRCDRVVAAVLAEILKRAPGPR